MTTLHQSFPRRNIVPDTVETVVRTDDDVLLWVEDNRPYPCQWDRHVAAPSGEMATEVARKEAAAYAKLHEEAQQMAAEVAEIDFMDAALADFRANGNGRHVGLHEDPDDYDNAVGRWESRQPFRF